MEVSLLDDTVLEVGFGPEAGFGRIAIHYKKMNPGTTLCVIGNA
jgi:hypothetical protein